MVLQILKFPLIALEVLVVFNLMIIVHELGHFLAAKWRGMVIEKFGIWFGKPLWRKNIGGVEYSFGTIPFGGFVSLPQMADMETIEGKSDIPREKLPKVSPLSKIIVAFAGPLFSFGLAVVFAVIVWLVGRPVSESEATTTVGYVLPDSPAARSGIQTGDKILSVDGHAVTRFSGLSSDSVSWDIARSEGETIPIVVERTVNGVTTQVPVNPAPHIEPTKFWKRKALREIGIEPAQKPMVAKVVPDSEADKAGLKPNDIITEVDGTPAYTFESMVDTVNSHPDPAHTLTVERDGQLIHLSLTPTGAHIQGVIPGSPAESGGLKAGDTIIAVNGKPTPDGMAVTEFVKTNGVHPLVFSVRDPQGATRTVTITPRIPIDDTDPHVGLVWDNEGDRDVVFGILEDAFGKFQVLHPSPAEQIKSSVMSIFNTVGAILSPKSDIKAQHMGGPFMMMRIYYMFFQSREGWRLALWFTVVLNVNLALINLLPIPVLDGGHIALALVEAVRRRPVNVRFLEVVQTTCALAIIGFMLYIAFFDVQDFFGPKETMHFGPKDAAPAQSQR